MEPFTHSAFKMVLDDAFLVLAKFGMCLLEGGGNTNREFTFIRVVGLKVQVRREIGSTAGQEPSGMMLPSLQSAYALLRASIASGS